MADFGASGRLATAESPSGALLAYCGSVVVKVHHPRTDPAALGERLQAVTMGGLRDAFVAPLSAATFAAPDGRRATVWPRVEVLDPLSPEPPWASAGRLLGQLHRAAQPERRLPLADPVARLGRALGRLPESEVSPLLRRLGTGVIAEAAGARVGSHLVHGDWHLGQLGRPPGEAWRLLDLDDLGVGDPVWDLGRPAGFWAAGLVPDAGWEAFLTAYRGAGGSALPPSGNPWPRLDLPARAAVVAAACRAVTRPAVDEQDLAAALFAVCREM